MPTAPARVLVVQHEADCPPGWVGGWLADAGLDLDVRRPYADEPLPSSLGDHDGYVVLGGSMGADDDASHPWLAPVKALTRRAAADGLPSLGICLGHQLFAVALGGAVRPNPAGRRTGLHRVDWLPDAADDPVLGTGDLCVQYNDDVVTRLPAAAVALARNDAGDLLAARFAPSVWGVQWHPEVGGGIYGAWTRSDAAAQPEQAEALAASVAQVTAAEPRLRASCEPAIRAYAAQVAARAAAQPRA